ncbi:MAG TPA: C-type lectin domain-containing protein [Kofleriaceae bacterium]|nr:C-type lectin domain-containing protein [Kofleriaceae bacterium]
MLILLAACGRVGFSERVESMTDARSDVGPDALTVTCPATYVALDATSRRYKLETALLIWQDASTACAADGTHLFVPDDALEMTTVTTYVGPVSTGGSVPDGSAWIGISDLAVEGTYVTEAGMAAPYLPWNVGQPDNSGGVEDCVHFLPNMVTNDLSCGSFMLPSVCECP